VRLKQVIYWPNFVTGRRRAFRYFTHSVQTNSEIVPGDKSLTSPSKSLPIIRSQSSYHSIRRYITTSVETTPLNIVTIKRWIACRYRGRHKHLTVF